MGQVVVVKGLGRSGFARASLLVMVFQISCFGVSPAIAERLQQTAAISIALRVLPLAQIEFPHGNSFKLKVPHGHSGSDHHGGHGKHHSHGHDKDHGNGHHDRAKDHEKGHGNGHDKHRGHGHKDHRKGDHEHAKGHDSVNIRPVLIPFRVRGNAWAAVSAKPSEYLRIQNGPWLGLARLQKDEHHDAHDKVHGKWHSHSAGTEDELGYNVIVHYPMPTWVYASVTFWTGFGEILREGFAALTGQKDAGTTPLKARVAKFNNGAYGMVYIVANSKWTRSGKYARSGDYSGSVELSVTADEY